MPYLSIEVRQSFQKQEQQTLTLIITNLSAYSKLREEETPEKSLRKYVTLDLFVDRGAMQTGENTLVWFVLTERLMPATYEVGVFVVSLICVATENKKCVHNITMEKARK